MNKKIIRKRIGNIIFLIILISLYLYLYKYKASYDKYYLEKNFKIINDRNNKLFINYYKTSEQKYENSSKKYWEKRYARGGNSGAGSYNNLAIFKASVLNDFVKKNNIKKVIEWGSGDCNQLSLENFKFYIGYDVSKTSIDICKAKFINDKNKIFIYMNESFKNDKKADLSISLDVIYHLLEDNVFNLYMQNLFNSSNKYVCIYSSNIDMKWAPHVRHRKFTDWIDKYISNRWKIKEYIPNKYPFELKKSDSTSFADFYIYEKIEYKFKYFNKFFFG